MIKETCLNKIIPIIEELEFDLPNLMHMWSPSNTQSDYECAFCRQRPKTNMTEIVHHESCLGSKIQDALKSA